MKAIWNGKVLAESDDTVIIEGNHYFPKNDVKWGYFKDSGSHTICPWKGTASYYNVVVDNKVNEDAAWYYPIASELAKSIENRVAFWKGVEVVK